MPITNTMRYYTFMHKRTGEYLRIVKEPTWEAAYTRTVKDWKSMQLIKNYEFALFLHKNLERKLQANVRIIIVCFTLTPETANESPC